MQMHSCQLPRPKIRPRWMMSTICAAFRYEHGILLCADSEYGYGSLTLPGQKLFPVRSPNCGMNLVFALAGSVPEGSSAIQTLSYALHSKSESMDKEKLRVFLGEELRLFYRDYIYSNPSYVTEKQPDFSLIIAAWFEDTKTLSLLRTDGPTPNIVGDYCLSGSGESLGSFVVGPINPYREHRIPPLQETILLASNMLYQVKKYVSSCGGRSVFNFIGDDGSVHADVDFGPLLPSSYSETFERIVADLFYASANLDVEDGRVSIKLALTDERICNIRAEQRAQRNQRDDLLRRLNELPSI